MLGRCIDGNENNTHQQHKEHRNKIANKFFSICPYFGKNGKRFSTTLIFKILIRQTHTVTKSIGENLSPKFLNDHIHHIILKGFGNAANHGGTYKQA